MEYKRLTDKETAYILKNTEGFSWDSDNAEAQRYIRLAELEDKIEKGILREVGDDEVVISKEEYERLKSYITEERAKEIFYELWVQNENEVRKETAKQILNELDRTPHEYHRRKIKEIAERYGVEIEGE